MSPAGCAGIIIGAVGLSFLLTWIVRPVSLPEMMERFRPKEKK